MPRSNPSARSLGVTLIPIQVKGPEDFDAAFATIDRERIDALLIVGEPMIGAQRERIAQLALDHRVPAISPFDLATEAGVLMSYSSSLVDEARSVPPYVDRILKGAKPADLPVERTTRFYLLINMQDRYQDRANGTPVTAEPGGSSVPVRRYQCLNVDAAASILMAANTRR